MRRAVARLTCALLACACSAPAPAAQPFLAAWREQTTDLVGYATAHQSSDSRRAAVAASLANESFSQADAATVLQHRFQLEQAVAQSVNQRDTARSAQQLAIIDRYPARYLVLPTPSPTSWLRPARVAVRLRRAGEPGGILDL